MYVSNEPVLSLYISLLVTKYTSQKEKPTFSAINQIDVFILLLYVFVKVDEEVHTLLYIYLDIIDVECILLVFTWQDDENRFWSWSP